MEGSVVTQIVLPVCLFILMLGMGLSLTTDDFTRVLRRPKAISVGLFGQIILLPICGFIVAVSLVDDPALAVGIMLLAACPGGTVSNVFAHLARGDLALSISLTAISGVFSFLSIPLIVGFSLQYFLSESTTVELPVMRTMGTLFVITLLPVAIGMAIKNFREVLAKSLERYISRFAILFLLSLTIIVVYQNKHQMIDSLMSVGLATLLLNLSAIVLGFLLALQFNLNNVQATSISLEVGIQNSATAMLIATSILNSPAIALPPAIYSLVMFFTGGLIVAVRMPRWRLRRQKESE